MSRATVDLVQRDITAAVAFVKQARQQLASAQIPGVDAESSYALSYQAAIKALTGALLAVGRRVTTGESGHLVLINEARSQIADEVLFDRLDRMRRTRHVVFYELGEVSAQELAGAHADAAAIIESAARFVLQHGRADG